ncbi:beta-ketoacyl synthase [Escherichia coli]|uniref:beta-ketoacyl synthase n=1 Tax=Escherichia coli TaxID=562 RepID=UPI0017AA829F|nr:beta-ketoacyl synthase [Escherichia coli]EFM2070613.1 beta-ketoacyl synthase [Escherichia coli]EHT1099323.1 beta-ketoacyl synthase [Escherichia coli]EIL1428119.1 beta-ketoacyl synthase [Escherichia coli]EJC3554659.1 beta-ketoacyl synthase [Escherichia coli]EJL1875346.1 beta-ketoacyl synthase [Escherichia coli]
MDNAAIISGYSVWMPYAEDCSQLIDNLKQGKRVARTPWFTSNEEAIKCGFKGNPSVATLKQVDDSALDLLSQLIDEALEQAMLDKHCLAGRNVRVYLTGIGPRIDGLDYKSFYNYNDVEDINLTQSITNLHAAKMSQDTISSHLARKYRLQYLPPNMNCTSNSSLTAVHLATQGIEQGGIDLAIVLNCSKIKTQDIWFLETQSMLDSEQVQPFGENSKGVAFAEGFSALLLESAHHRRARQQSEGVRVQTTYTQISAGRSNDASWLSTNVHKVMHAAMKQAEIALEDLAAILPHGNGSAVSDNAEAKAITMFAGERQIPVLAYKGQIGYTATGSGVVDLIIGHHSLTHHQLIAPVGNDVIIDSMASLVLTDGSVTNHSKRHLLKVGVGVDGSVIGVVMSNMQAGRAK